MLLHIFTLGYTDAHISAHMRVGCTHLHTYAHIFANKWVITQNKRVDRGVVGTQRGTAERMYSRKDVQKQRCAEAKTQKRESAKRYRSKGERTKRRKTCKFSQHLKKQQHAHVHGQTTDIHVGKLIKLN